MLVTIRVVFAMGELLIGNECVSDSVEVFLGHRSYVAGSAGTTIIATLRCTEGSFLYI